MLQIARSLAAGIYVFQYAYTRIYTRHTLAMRQYNTYVMRIYITYCTCIYTEIGFSGFHDFWKKCRAPAPRGVRARRPHFFRLVHARRSRSDGAGARPRHAVQPRGPLHAACGVQGSGDRKTETQRVRMSAGRRGRVLNEPGARSASAKAKPCRRTQRKPTTRSVKDEMREGGTAQPTGRPRAAPINF